MAFTAAVLSVHPPIIGWCAVAKNIFLHVLFGVLQLMRKTVSNPGKDSKLFYQLSLNKTETLIIECGLLTSQRPVKQDAVFISHNHVSLLTNIIRT